MELFYNIKANDPMWSLIKEIPHLNNIINFDELQKIYNIEKYDNVLKCLYKKLPFELVCKIYQNIDPTVNYQLFKKSVLQCGKQISQI